MKKRVQNLGPNAGQNGESRKPNNLMKGFPMKKLFIIITMLLFGVANAQNYLHINIADVQYDGHVVCCLTDYDGIVLEKESGCNEQAEWWIYNHWTNQLLVHEYSNELTFAPNETMTARIGYKTQNCGITNRWFFVHFLDLNIPEPFIQDYVWKRTGTTTTLSVDYTDYCSYLWSNGSHQTSITVSQPGTYWVRIYNDCGEISDTIQVRDNVEIYRATTELTSNLNQVTWRVSDAQAQYISEVKVYRNNQHVGTAPYTDGVFTDDIGSENTQWQYHIVAVSKEGQNCPYKSYWKRTIHLDHIQGSQGNQILQWTPYEQENTGNPVSAYNIYDVVDGEPRLVMQVGNFTNVFAYNPADFDGFGTVAAVFGGKGIEDMAFSNRTAEILTVGENESDTFKVYPNPAQGHFTVEGSGTMTVTNVIGQTVLAREIDGKESVELPQGIYFVRLNGATRKIVVE